MEYKADIHKIYQKTTQKNDIRNSHELGNNSFVSNPRVLPIQQIPPHIFDELFLTAKNAFENQNSNELFQVLEQLIQIYSNGYTFSYEFAAKHEFLDGCQSLISFCPNTTLVMQCLNCILFGIESDHDFYIYFSDIHFAKQLTFYIDENGSDFFEVGLTILTRIIQGYSDEIFEKLVYIYYTTEFYDKNGTMSDRSKNHITCFSLVFLKLSNYIIPVLGENEKPTAEQVAIAKKFIPIAIDLFEKGVYSYSFKIFINLTNFPNDYSIALKLCTANSQHTSSFFNELVSSLPNINNYDTMIDALIVINQISAKWDAGFYPAMMNRIDCEFLYCLMTQPIPNNSQNTDPNQNNFEIDKSTIEKIKKIKEQATLVFAYVFKSEHFADALKQHIVQTIFDHMVNAPYETRKKAMKALCQTFSKCSLAQMGDLISWGIIDVIIEFLEDPDTGSDASFSLFKISQTEHVKSLIPYIEELTNIRDTVPNSIVASSLYNVIVAMNRYVRENENAY